MQHPISKLEERHFEADLDISIDQSKGKIQISPKYAVLEVKVKSGTGDTNEEPFCQLLHSITAEKVKKSNYRWALVNSMFNFKHPSIRPLATQVVNFPFKVR